MSEPENQLEKKLNWGYVTLDGKMVKTIQGKSAEKLLKTLK